MTSPFYVGKRLSYDGHPCTIRYIGEVDGTEGQWLGVEWDDPTRGKHSGEHAGVRYFKCVRPHPTAASFVRPTRPSDPPRTFLEALRHKYASEASLNYSQGDSGVVLGHQADDQQSAAVSATDPIRISGKEVEEIGFDKVRRQLAALQELRIVLLDGLCVASSAEGGDVGKAHRIRETCPKIVELDLSRNLFEEWREVGRICMQLEKLKFLRVDRNRFRDLSLEGEDEALLTSPFKNVSTLSLDDTFLSWEETSSILQKFPSISSLAASSNAFGSLGPYPLPASITELTLEDNDFHALSELAPLAALPNLGHLSLKDNSIGKINLEVEREQLLGSDYRAPAHLNFSNRLNFVDLSRNAIDSWSFIDALPAVFPGLTSLRVAHNPLYQNLQAADGRPLTPDDGYTLTIARLGSLQTLNYSPIKPKDRLNAETYYLSQIGAELSQHPPSAHPSVLARHPRYTTLAALHGAPAVASPSGNRAANTLAARFLKLTFRLDDSVRKARTKSSQENTMPHESSIDQGSTPVEASTEGEFVTRVPKAWSVYSVLGLVGKTLGLPPLRLRLVWETGEWEYAREEGAGDEVDWWDSEEEDEEELRLETEPGDQLVRGTPIGKNAKRRKVPREVEVVAGTRPMMTWIEGDEALVRVEMR